jgi:hypothetical protein
MSLQVKKPSLEQSLPYKADGSLSVASPQREHGTKCSEKIISNRSEMVLRAHYPEENPREALEGITDALLQVGIFDGIKE